MNLIEAMTKKRKAEKLSLRALEKICGVSFATLSRLQRGSIPDENTILRLNDWLGLEEAELEEILSQLKNAKADREELRDVRRIQYEAFLDALAKLGEQVTIVAHAAKAVSMGSGEGD